MKKTFALFVACAAAALALVSCQKVDNAPASVAKTVHFTAQTLDTKTAFGAYDSGFYPTYWTANDENVKILANSTSSPVLAPVTPSVVDYSTATFNAELTDDGSGSYIFYAVSPAAAFTSYTSGYKSFGVTVSGNQTPSATSPDEAAMLIAAKSAVYEPSFPSSVDLSFLHATAYGKLTLTNLATVGGETIQTVKLTLTHDEKWTGSGFYYIEDYETHSACDLVPASTASKELLINTNSASDIWFACMPTTALGGEDIDVLVTTNKSTYARTITIPDGKNFEAGVIAEFTVDMTSAVKETAPVYSLIPASTGANGDHTNYAAAVTTTIDGIDWSVMANSNMVPWRIGGKKSTTQPSADRPVYSQTAIANNISKIVITHGNASDITVNSMKVYVCSTAAGAAADTPTDVVASFTPDFVANGDVVINKADATSWANCYYRIVYNVYVSVTSNKYIQLNEVKFYE